MRIIKSIIRIITKIIRIIRIMQIIHITIMYAYRFLLVCLYCLVCSIINDLDTKNQKSKLANTRWSTVCMYSSASALMPFQTLSQTVKIALWMAATCDMWTLGHWDGLVICTESLWHTFPAIFYFYVIIFFKGGADTVAFINTAVSVWELHHQATPRGRHLYQPQVSNQEPFDSETSAWTTAPPRPI